METKSLISLIFCLQAIINCVNFVSPANEQQTDGCSKGKFQSDFKELDKAFENLGRFISYSPSNGEATGNGDKVYTVSLCSIDLRKEDCQGCVKRTIPYLRKQCPSQNEGIAWTVLNNAPNYGHCIVRYADYNSKSQLLTWASTTISSTSKESPGNTGELEKGFNTLMDKLKSTYAGHPNKIGSGSITYGPGAYKLYGFMQCTSITSKENCEKCFSDATNNILKCCVTKRKWEGRALHSNCYIRYSHYDFLATIPWL